MPYQRPTRTISQRTYLLLQEIRKNNEHMAQSHPLKPLRDFGVKEPTPGRYLRAEAPLLSADALDVMEEWEDARCRISA